MAGAERVNRDTTKHAHHKNNAGINRVADPDVSIEFGSGLQVRSDSVLWHASQKLMKSACVLTVKKNFFDITVYLFDAALAI